MGDPRSPLLIARLAGVSYLIIIFVGGFGFAAASSLITSGDPAATMRRILASEEIWRLAIAANLVMLVADVAVASLLYVLLKPVNRTASLLAFAFRLVMTSIIGFAMVLRLLPLMVLQGDTLGSLAAAQREELAYLSLRVFEHAFAIALFFFSFCCLVKGWLILNADFLPRVIGFLLAIGGLCYLANSLFGFVFPAVDLPLAILAPAAVAELALAVWLTVFGANAEKWKQQAGAVPGNIGSPS